MYGETVHREFHLRVLSRLQYNICLFYSCDKKSKEKDQDLVMFAEFYSNDALITDQFWQHKFYKYPTTMAFL